jgi:hypothetical protein
MRIIPKQTKVTIEFFKNVELADIAVGMAGAALAVSAFASNIPGNLYVAGIVVAITAILIVPIDDIKGYNLLLQLLKYISRPKVFTRESLLYDEAPDAEGEDAGEPQATKKRKKAKAKQPAFLPVDNIMGFTGIGSGAIEYGGNYYGKVLSVDSIEFRFFSEFRQNNIIDKVLGGVIRTIGGEQTMLLVKVDRPVIFDNYVNSEFDKVDNLKESYLNGLIAENELTKRAEIVFDRIEDIFRINHEDKVFRPYHYFVLLDKNLRQLTEITESLAQQLQEGGLPVKVLEDRDIAVFLKYNFTADFDEREIDQLDPEAYMDWIMPRRVEFASRSIKYDGLVTNTLRVIGYPTTVGNAWGHRVFNIPDTKVVMKLSPVDRSKAIRNIDRSIDELRSQEQSTGKTSRILELAGHIDTLAELLTLLQNDNEALYDVTLTVTVMDYEQTQLDELKAQLAAQAREADAQEASAQKSKSKGKRRGKKTPTAPQSTLPSVAVSAKKRIKRLLSEDSLRTSDMFLQQFEAYCCSVIGVANPLKKRAHAIHSTSIAASFPFVYSSIMDEGGFNIGNSSGVPVFINFFKRDRERVNSNMVVIGKSGGGKSFAAKTILSHLAAEDSKIFILDPENEYAELAGNLDGKLIDVGTATHGRMNPFHIITALTDEEGDTEEKSTAFPAHLQFLEEFFKQILPGIDSEPLEFLNSLIVRTYAEKGIDEYSDFSAMQPEDFPIFDDLYDRILTEFQKFESDYNKNILRTLLNYISKFSVGGRNANLWNGAASISTKENFIVFNFQSLLANKNNTIANAQMLLVLKWLDNEIIKNRDYNMKYNASRKIVIVIDEAHVFIDEKFPIALDFMHQLAKRIRKYNGMQIIITQNVRDFVGTEDIARKSTAIINACQYSMIFPLSPNDMHDLCKLYEKAGAINETEQEEIVNNGRGRAFLITSPQSRTSVNIVATPAMQQLFQ